MEPTCSTRASSLNTSIWCGLGDKTWCNGDAYSLADIATGAALSYLDLRHRELGWRDDASNLDRLLQKLSKRPSFENTRPALG
jgi:glutathione S-transferase